jgi:Protein of unknown function (DUF1449)
VGVVEQLLTPAYLPFAIAFVVMLGIGLIEAIGLGLGHLDLDSGLGPDGGHAPGATLLDWLGIGDLPILIWLTSLLACFTVLGIAVQQLTAAWLGAPLPAALAAGGALLGGLTLNTFVANGLARILPGLETTAITSDDLVRLRGTVLEGAARRGQPARAKVVDHYGQAHYVMVEPHEDSDVIAQGDTALLVRREGSLFFALPEANTLRAL